MPFKPLGNCESPVLLFPSHHYEHGKFKLSIKTGSGKAILSVSWAI